MSNDAVPEAPMRRSNIGLIVSICLNLVFAGVIAMDLVRMSMLPPPMMAGRGLFAPQALMHMLPGTAEKIQRIVDAHDVHMDMLKAAAMDARRDARRAFMAHDFSRQTFDQSLERVKAADAALEAERLKAVSESVAALTPDERRAFVEKVRERNNSWWRLLRPRHDH